MQFQCQRPGCRNLTDGRNKFCGEECRREFHLASVADKTRKRSELRAAIKAGKAKCPTCGHSNKLGARRAAAKAASEGAEKKVLGGA